MSADQVSAEIRASIAVKNRILEDESLTGDIGRVAALCLEALRRGNRILLAGNGGSAADAQHIAAEFVSRYAFDRPGLPALAFTTDTSMLTAIGNDYGFDSIFSRQLEANGRRGDVFIGISTSGNSANVLAAMRQAREMDVAAVALTGQSGGAMPAVSDFCLCIPSDSTPRIQESHIMVGHIICGIVERGMFAKGGQ